MGRSVFQTTVEDPATFKEQLPALRETLIKGDCSGAYTKCGEGV